MYTFRKENLTISTCNKNIVTKIKLMIKFLISFNLYKVCVTDFYLTNAVLRYLINFKKNLTFLYKIRKKKILPTL